MSLYREYRTCRSALGTIASYYLDGRLSQENTPPDEDHIDEVSSLEQRNPRTARTSVGNEPPAGGTPPAVPGRQLNPSFDLIAEYEMSGKIDIKPYSGERGHA